MQFVRLGFYTLVLFLFVVQTTSAQEQPWLSACGWQSLRNDRYARMEALSVSTQGHLYVLSGFTEGLKILRDCSRYTPATDTWTTLAPIPYPVTHAGVIVINDQIWVLGGFKGDHPGVAIATVQIYDLRNNAWSTGPALPYRRASMGAALLGRKIHVFGGLKPDRQTDTNEHWVLDLDRLYQGWRSAAPLPKARNHLSGASLGGQVYAIGGQRGHDRPNGVFDVAFVHSYHSATDTWTRRADLPFPRSHFEPGTLVADGAIYIVGGRTLGQYFSQITRYDPVSNEWTDQCPLPDRLVAPSAGLFDDELVVTHGGLNSWQLPVRTARKRPFSRDRKATLGFIRRAIDITLPPRSSLQLDEVLYTLSDTARFTLNLSELPTWWLQVDTKTTRTTPSGETIRLSVNTHRLRPGAEYRTTLVARAPDYETTWIPITLRVTSEASSEFQPSEGIANSTKFNPHTTSSQAASTGKANTGRIYPVPAESYFVLRGTWLSALDELTLIDPMGKVHSLRQVTQSNGHEEVRVSLTPLVLAPGVYTVQAKLHRAPPRHFKLIKR